MKLPYEPGTRYSNSLTYDVATTEVVHGWQVFEQRNADGTPTGRKGFINHRGCLCSLTVAEMMRKEASRDAVQHLITALDCIEAQVLLVLTEGGAMSDQRRDALLRTIAELAGVTLTKACGVRP